MPLFFKKRTLALKLSLALTFLSLSLSPLSASLISEKSNEFGFDLSPQLNYPDQNNFYSPFSIFYALSILSNGAESATRSEIEKVLHWDSDRETMANSFDKLNKTIQAEKKTEEDSSSGSFIVRNTNTLFISNRCLLKDSFQDFIEAHYGAKIDLVDFFNPSEASKKINESIAASTHNKIDRLVQSSDIKPSTKAMLVNALYFQGHWSLPFDPVQTQSALFTADYFQKEEEEETCHVQMMHQESCFKYFENSLEQAIILPFQSDLKKTAPVLVVAMPNNSQNFQEWSKQITPEKLNNWLQESVFSKVNLKLPKFSFRKSYELETPLKKLGIETAFSHLADFSSLSNSPLYIEKIMHEAFLDIDEKGMEAAAATVISIGLTSIQIPQDPPSISFNANRPFVFFLVDYQTKTLLFMGQFIGEPNEE